jgi:hypothetical protein
MHAMPERFPAAARRCRREGDLSEFDNLGRDGRAAAARAETEVLLGGANAAAVPACLGVGGTGCEASAVVQQRRCVFETPLPEWLAVTSRPGHPLSSRRVSCLPGRLPLFFSLAHRLASPAIYWPWQPANSNDAGGQIAICGRRCFPGRLSCPSRVCFFLPSGPSHWPAGPRHILGRGPECCFLRSDSGLSLGGQPPLCDGEKTRAAETHSLPNRLKLRRRDTHRP